MMISSRGKPEARVERLYAWADGDSITASSVEWAKMVLRKCVTQSRPPSALACGGGVTKARESMRLKEECVLSTTVCLSPFVSVGCVYGNVGVRVFHGRRTPLLTRECISTAQIAHRGAKFKGTMVMLPPAEAGGLVTGAAYARRQGKGNAMVSGREGGHGKQRKRMDQDGKDSFLLVCFFEGACGRWIASEYVCDRT